MSADVSFSLVTSPLHTYTYKYPIKSPLNLIKFLWNQNSTFSYLIPFHIAQVAPGASKCRAVMCGRRTFGGPPGQLGKNGEKLGFSEDFSRRNWTKHREFIRIFPTNWKKLWISPTKTGISLDRKCWLDLQLWIAAVFSTIKRKFNQAK